ncbi:tripartite tricarboxylate transporter substrate binding protein [Bordetella sp. BOR01]|uniref:Bug family tripartite tricarboxylate transporter substrate binding protein n=1 Tax=Bordetella sp. BOR01 TaxID=2854779 RepID=UPI001C493CA7|nr:tripartite tricarboxylate transporter substrate binding protein [Bordetella sp. BOR01]MBV7483111.1 tripartite tricarboxylate transporter substrate binding protein [Bordetella sp. BOR01]
MRAGCRAWLLLAGQVALAVSVATCTLAARADDVFPGKPVRMIVAFPAGGGTDIVARLIAERLTALWGQQVIVDNRGGAGGVIGTEIAARSPADGYTIFMATLGNLSINPHLYKMDVDPVTDLAPISNVVDVNFVLIANPKLPVHNVKDLIALAKREPGQINYSSSGVGGAPHLAGELFNDMAGVQLTHIPYKGSGPSFTDLLGGQVSLTFDSLVQALPHIQDGKLRALAVLADHRSPLLPKVPTLAEAGVPGYNFANWFGLVAPAGTPAERIAKLNAAVRKVLQEPAVRERLADMGAVPAGTTPEAFGQLIRDERAKWGKIIQDRGIRAQ